MSTIESHAIVRITPEMAGIRLSPVEFDAIEDWDEDYKYELVDGVLVVVPPPSAGERGPNEELGYLLNHYKREHPEGSALDWTLHENLVNTPSSRRRADRVLWTGLGRTPRARKDLPTIAVEFVSRGKRDAQRDYEEKREEYLSVGLLEYWIIDRFRRTMTVIRHQTGGAEEIVVQESGTYKTPLLPGFELPLAKLLSVADMLENADEREDDV